MAIKDWPKEERPREKLLEQGASRLSDSELLAIFLHTGVRGKSAVEIAQEILQHFGGLRPLLQAGAEEFCAMRGLGQAKYVQLQASLEISRRHFMALMRRQSALTSPDATRQYLKAQLRDRCREVFACLFLDNRHRVMAYEELFFGTIDSASVHPREVVKRALTLNAAAVILAHNHPSGVPEPSRADEQVTTRLKEALGLVEIPVLDHLIVGDGDIVSFAERGLL